MLKEFFVPHSKLMTDMCFSLAKEVIKETPPMCKYFGIIEQQINPAKRGYDVLVEFERLIDQENQYLLFDLPELSIEETLSKKERVLIDFLVDQNTNGQCLFPDLTVNSQKQLVLEVRNLLKKMEEK
jgi:hypothetical protein